MKTKRHGCQIGSDFPRWIVLALIFVIAPLAILMAVAASKHP